MDNNTAAKMSMEITKLYSEIAHLRGQVAYLSATNANLIDILRKSDMQQIEVNKFVASLFANDNNN